MSDDNPIKTWKHMFMIWRAFPLTVTRALFWNLPYYGWVFCRAVFNGARNEIRRR